MDTLVKENSKPKKLLDQNMQKIWDTMKIPNLRIIGIKEREDTQVKGIEMFSTKS